MQVVTLIIADILLLLLIVAGVCVERRVTRMEMTRTKESSRTRELRREVERLRRRVADAEESDLTDIEVRRAKDAERRFTEGVASILSYGRYSAGKEAEHGEDAGV